MVSVRPPIRVVTRALAEMQTTILSEGLQLTKGDLERFAIFSLIFRLTSTGTEAPESGRGVTVASLAHSLAKPYETVRRHVNRLVADGLCDRHLSGVSSCSDPAGQSAIRRVWVIAHEALIRFVERLKEGLVELPLDRQSGGYSRKDGVIAAVDLMLTVVDGNREVHVSWIQLAIFSAIASKDFARVLDSPAASRAFRDETRAVPLDLRASTRAATIATLLHIPETTVRRHVIVMVGDGRLVRTTGGFCVSEEWLNQPRSVAVSRRSFINVRRVLEQLAARDFPFDTPSSARSVGGF